MMGPVTSFSDKTDIAVGGLKMKSIKGIGIISKAAVIAGVMSGTFGIFNKAMTLAAEAELDKIILSKKAKMTDIQKKETRVTFTPGENTEVIGFNLGIETNSLREKLAELAHDQWSGWEKYQFSKGTFNEDGTWTMPKWAVERWIRQMNTPFSDLSEEEKDNDRAEADRFLAIIEMDKLT